jgi:hypothetical protein
MGVPEREGPEPTPGGLGVDVGMPRRKMIPDQKLTNRLIWL